MSVCVDGCVYRCVVIEKAMAVMEVDAGVRVFRLMGVSVCVGVFVCCGI